MINTVLGWFSDPRLKVQSLSVDMLIFDLEKPRAWIYNEQ